MNNAALGKTIERKNADTYKVTCLFRIPNSILELKKILIYDFQYDYVKPKYGEKANLCYKDL